MTDLESGDPARSRNVERRHFDLVGVRAHLFLRGAILVVGIGVVVLAIMFRDDGPVGGYPDIHRRRSGDSRRVDALIDRWALENERRQSA